jgi:hypothetical protein
MRPRRFTDELQHGVDMNTTLLTPDGFPRADIDVAQSTMAGLSSLEGGNADRHSSNNKSAHHPPAE